MTLEKRKHSGIRPLLEQNRQLEERGSSFGVSLYQIIVRSDQNARKTSHRVRHQSQSSDSHDKAVNNQKSDIFPVQNTVLKRTVSISHAQS